MRKLTPDMCRPFSVDIFLKRLAGKPVVERWTEEVDKLREQIAFMQTEMVEKQKYILELEQAIRKEE